MAVGLIDYHCHLDLFPDHAKAVMECERKEVSTLTMTTTPRAWARNQELTVGTRFVRAALGFHPQLVATHSHEIELWEACLPEARYVGEIGLDAGPQFFRSIELQKEIFERVLRNCSLAGGKILSVHSVRASTLVLDMLERHLDMERNQAVLHWFTGSGAEAKRAYDLGCYFSINIQMFDSARHRDTVAMLPLERILTETDAPFAKYKGRELHSSDISIVLGMLARLKGMHLKDVIKVIKSNLATIEALQAEP